MNPRFNFQGWREREGEVEKERQRERERHTDLAH
jgi:hypothetical protein